MAWPALGRSRYYEIHIGAFTQQGTFLRLLTA
jgi:hypothetical protein